MATINYGLTVSGAVVLQITNKLAASEKVYLEDHIGIDGKTELDPGTLQHATILVETTEGANKGKHYFVKDNSQWVQLYRTNQWVKINGGDILEIAVDTSEEVAYFMSLKGDLFNVAQKSS